MSSFDYSFDDLFNPCLKALRNLGGSATNAEIEEQVIQILKLSDEEVNDIHRDTTTKIHYRLRWARNYLKRFGLLENSSRGVWALTGKGQQTKQVDQKEVMRTITALDHKSKKSEKAETEEVIQDEDGAPWQEKLLEVLKKMDPAAFERLSQRLLRELGFNNVEVTGKTGDGGIDGKGILNNRVNNHI